MRRNSAFPFLLFFFIFGIGLDLIDLFLPIFIGYMIFKAIFGDNKKDVRKRTVQRTYNTRRVKKVEEKVDKNAINRKLRKYFNDNYKLRLYEEVALTTNKGEYKDFDSLYVSVNDEMICSLREFGENHPDTYQRILKLLDTFAKQKEEIKQTPKVERTKTQTSFNKKTTAQDYIEKINALNNEIPHVEITNSLNQTCDYLKRIDSAEKKEDAKLTKLYDYYLPILVSILENYKTLQVNKENDEFKKSESQLIKLTILINDALKAINDSLHSDEYINMNADMTTLESLLKKDILDDNFGG